MVNGKLSLWDGEILENHFQGLAYYEGEHQLSADDALRCANALTLWCLTVGDIAFSYELERTYSLANLVRWPGQPSLDIAQLLADVKSCLAVLRDYDPWMGRHSYRSFKLWLRERLGGMGVFEFLRPLFYRLYFEPITAFRDLNTVLQFWTRLTLCDADWLDETMLSDYVELESDMTLWEYPETTTDCLNYIVRQWFIGFSIDGLRPDFSNGATAETRRGAGIQQKIRCRRTIKAALADTLISFNSPYYTEFDLIEPPAVWQTVPKGIDKRRGISKEPTVKQYYQKALADHLEYWFKTHSEIHVDLNSQEKSRQLCLQGSSDCKWSTIDLSSASDTITWKLVKKLIRGIPALESYLAAVRTEMVELTDGSVLKMAKYAPMGSSLCFPLECIVFAAVASYACWVSGIPQKYQVYGDDIVIDSRAFNACVQLLTDLHFTVNVDKSFGPTSHFLEACGMEAYMGVDVSPCRIPRRFDIVKLRRSKSPQQLDCAIKLANRLSEYGLRRARRHLVCDILAVYPQVPFSVNPELGIYHPDPQNFHLKRRWNSDLQRCEVQIVTSHAEQAKGSDDIRYLRTLDVIELRAEAAYTFHNVGELAEITPLNVACGQTRDSLRKKWISLEGLR